MHYVLSARETYYVPRVSIAAYVAPTLRDGTLGKARPIEPSALGSASGAHVAPADRTIGRLLSVSVVELLTLLVKLRLLRRQKQAQNPLR